MPPQLPDTVEHWPIDRLIPYARNARTHDDNQVAQIAASIVEFGWTNPILADAEGGIVAGHGRLLAARKLGIDTVPVVVLDHLTPAQRRAYVIADNKLALNAGWNEELLASELHALNGEGFDLELTGFSEAELDALMAPLGDETETIDDDGEDAADDMPAPPREAVSRAGDLWLIGKHRLLCGDSTDSSVVARVMNGERAVLVFTSPPYGNQRDYTTGGVGDWDALMRGVFATLPVADSAQVLVNLGLVHRDNEWQPYWQTWLDWMREQGWRRFGLYVWDQGPGLPGDWNGRLAPAFEFVFHFNRKARKPNKIVPCKWAGHVNDTHGGIRHKDGHVGEWTHAGQGVQETRIPDNVIRITRHKARGIETEHPAVFPVALPEFVMRAYSSERDNVYEPFAGSGTSIIAAERCGRRTRAIELAPEYVDVALRRWRKLFPDKPVKLDGEGQSFEAVARERGVAIPDDD
ncbi:MAG: DNA modification methylase [Nitrobacter sp. 62-13]|uniref:site-specific DNA-methyltransferase n=1 Tax=Nitrobacter sp. 62-13 TaxID=1895797 RepID=UPI0009633B07|nr:site-specific DNA-methyltransferase [Nitrobacter sp. 62-13]OJU26687.1 MAG: DNA modification methylase [Nitrobacter sp. 62-13]